MRCSLELDLAGGDVVEELWRDGDKVSSLAEVERILDDVRVEAFLLVLEFLQFKGSWNKDIYL